MLSTLRPRLSLVRATGRVRYCFLDGLAFGDARFADLALDAAARPMNPVRLEEEAAGVADWREN